MKAITVEIDEKEMEELGITSDRISLAEFERYMSLKELRKQRDELEKENIKLVMTNSPKMKYLI